MKSVIFYFIVFFASPSCFGDQALPKCIYLDREQSSNAEEREIFKDFPDASVFKVCDARSGYKIYYVLSKIFSDSTVNYYYSDRVERKASGGGWKHAVSNSESYLDKRSVFMCKEDSPCEGYGDVRFVTTHDIPLSAFARFKEVWVKALTSKEEFDVHVKLNRSKESVVNNFVKFKERLFTNELGIHVSALNFARGDNAVAPGYRLILGNDSDYIQAMDFDFSDTGINVTNARFPTQ